MITKKQNQNSEQIFWQDRILLVIFTICICNQGSFFEGGILAAVFALSAMCLFKRVALSKSDIGIFGFCIWHFVCSLNSEICLEYMAKGMLPLVSFLFYLLVNKGVKNFDKFEEEFVKVALVISGISILECLLKSVSVGSLQRSLFPFGYSNVCGIFFGTMFLFSEKRFNFKYAKFIFLVALILTQSIGAIGISVVLWMISDIKNKHNLIVLAGVVVFGVIFRGRLSESIYTFAERLLQMYDGLLCIKDNLVFGIGVGRWNVVRPMYQSGFYNASVIHNSFVQMAVNCGVTGLVVFVGSLIVPVREIFKKDKRRFVCVVAMILHALVDLTFSYAAMGMLFAFMLRKEKNEIKNFYWLQWSACMVFAFTLLVVLSPVKTMEKNIAKGNPVAVVNAYQKEPMLVCSIDAKKIYIRALYLLNQYDKILDEINTFELQSSDIYLIRSWCGDKNALKEGLKLQPYNVALYEEIYKTNDEGLKKESDTIKEVAIKNMSYLGSFLYKEKGENNK